MNQPSDPSVPPRPTPARPAKAKRAPERVPGPLLVPSAELAVALGTEPRPRTQLTTDLWAYIRRHRLQDKKDPSTIHADDALRPIFEADEISMFTLPRRVAAHVSPAPALTTTEGDA